MSREKVSGEKKKLASRLLTAHIISPLTKFSHLTSHIFMRNLLIFSVLAILLGGAGCKNEEKGKTINGNEFTLFHTGKKGGKMPVEDLFAKVQMYTYLNDSLVQSTRKSGEAEFIPIPKKDDPRGAQIPPHFIECLKKMVPGDSLILFENMDSIPPLPPQYSWVKTVSYHIVLEDVLSMDDRKAIAEEQQKKVMAGREEMMKLIPGIEKTVQENIAAWNQKSLGDKLKTTASGLQYVILSEGDGPAVAKGDQVKVHYYGALMDTKRFDDSFSRGEPIALQVGTGQVIAGWDEGLQLFKKGTKVLLFIPYELAYGEAGNPPTIPAKSMLAFYTDIQK